MKKKSNLFQKTASPEQIYEVHKNNIKVYPVQVLGLWFIESETNGRKHRFPKSVSQNDLNEAVALTVIFYYNKLKEKK